jgi:hypothetical protein
VSDRGRIWEAWGSDRIWREVGDCGDVRSVAAQGEVVLTFLGFLRKRVYFLVEIVAWYCHYDCHGSK